MSRTIRPPRAVPEWMLVLAAAAGLAGLALATAPLTITMEKADPSFYLSYVLDYEAIAARFGQTYHGNRLSYLLVDRAAFAALGPEAGYFAARWVALSIAVLATIAMARPRIGRAGAVAVGAAVALTPWLPRQLLWVHYDGFAVTYVLVAAWLLLGPVEQRWRRLAAGAVLGLAVNANLGISVIAAGLTLGWWAAVVLPVRRRVLGVLDVAVGFVLVELLLSVVLRVLVGSGPWFIETIAIRVALFLAGDENTWFQPLATVLRGSPQLVLVPSVGVAAMMVGRRARRDGDEGQPMDSPDAAVLGGVWLVVAGAAVLALHLGVGSAWLSNRFYVVQFLPPLAVGLVGLAGRAVGLRAGEDLLHGWAIPLAATATLVLAWSTAVVLPVAVWSAVAALAVLVAVAVRGGMPGAVAGGVVATVLSVTLGAPGQAVSAGAWGDLAARERFEWTVFEHLRSVQALVEREVPSDRDVVFWHRTDDPEAEWLRRINMAYYGTGGGRLHRDKPPLVGMPELTSGQLEGLASRAPITVVLLGVERSEVTAGLVALSAAMPGSRQVAQEVLAGDSYDVHVALVEVG